MQLGITIDRSGSSAVDQARAAEAAGFDFVGSGEHLFFHGPTSNAFITLAAAAGATQRIRLMSALTLLPLYPAALAAKLTAMLDVVSGGRFELGVGLGGEHPPEFAAVGVPVTERARRADEALALLHRLLTGEALEAGGARLVLDPPPVQRPRPPIIVGGRRAGSQRRAGRYGDAWMPYLVTPDQLARGLAVARACAQEHGRSPVTGAVYLWTAVHRDGDTARRTAVEVVSRIYRQDFAPLADRYLIAGTPSEVAERMRAYHAAGAERILVAPVDATTVELVGGEVLAALRS